MIDEKKLDELDTYDIPILNSNEYSELIRLARLGLKSEKPLSVTATQIKERWESKNKETASVLSAISHFVEMGLWAKQHGIPVTIAVREYDKAIATAANDPKKMSTLRTAEGKDLDDLYADWHYKVKDALAALPKEKE